jgi:arsenate reductase
MTIYHYAGCGTCKKALKWLEAQGLRPTRVDLVATPPSRAALSDLWRRSGRPLERFFNTSGQSYRDGDFKARLPGMSEADKLAALAADGKLVKRPILDLGEAVLVGFDEAAWQAALATR